MSNAPGLRERKKAATRRSISDIATRLFIERGFDNVTVADIAEQANVSRLTVFNYFPHKEDLFFDREGEGEALIEAALAERLAGQTLDACLRRLFRRMLRTDHPFVSFTPGVGRFWRTVRESPALSARTRQMRDEFASRLAQMLAAAVARARPDAEARLAAAILVSVWTAAYAEGLQRFEAGADLEAAHGAFASLVERGLDGLAAALSGTAYAARTSGPPPQSRG